LVIVVIEAEDDLMIAARDDLVLIKWTTRCGLIEALGRGMTAAPDLAKRAVRDGWSAVMCDDGGS
jgi:hypothetical protein